jgi:hypothetical protein
MSGMHLPTELPPCTGAQIQPGKAALALAGITATVLLGFAPPAFSSAQTPASTTTVREHHTTTTDSGNSSSGGGNGCGGHRSHPSTTPTRQEIPRWQSDLSKLSYYDGRTSTW